MLEAWQDATTSFVIVEPDDAEEQFDEIGAPPPASPDHEGDLEKFCGRPATAVELGRGFGRALGRLFYGK